MRKNTVKVKDIKILPVVGVYSHERIAGQEIRIDITIEHVRPTIDDELDSTFDYMPVIQAIEEYATTHKPYLIETVGEHVADICLAVDGVEKVIVEVKKPHASKNGAVSVVVERTN